MKTCRKQLFTALTMVAVVVVISCLAYGEEKPVAKPDAKAVTAVKTTAETAATGVTVPVKPLPSTMVYEMKQLNATLDKAEKYAKAKNQHESQRVFKSVKHQWDTKKGWNKGKFDPKHPDVLTLEARFAKIGKMIEELGQKGDTDKK